MCIRCKSIILKITSKFIANSEVDILWKRLQLKPRTWLPYRFTTDRPTANNAGEQGPANNNNVVPANSDAALGLKGWLLKYFGQGMNLLTAQRIWETGFFFDRSKDKTVLDYNNS